MDNIRNILLVENSGRDFYNSRINLAIFLIKQGYNVSVLVPHDDYVEKIKSSGLQVFTFQSNGKRLGLNSLIAIIKACRKLYRTHNFHCVHSFRFYPNLINALTSWNSSRKSILHVTGLGIVYSSNSFKFKIYRLIYNFIYFFIVLISDCTIVQNPDDKKNLGFFKIVDKKIILIKGSGVDTNLFSFNTNARQRIRNEFDASEQQTIFMCVTRLIWEKGVVEMVKAFQKNTTDFPDARLIIVGDPDFDNPNHVTINYIKENNKGNVLFLGRKSNIAELLSAADIFLFPSYYREGIPRGLLEALSIGMPIITTSMPGCNLTVDQGENGLLIEPRSTSAISEAIGYMLINKDQFLMMGQKSRSKAFNEFSENIIFNQILGIYKSLDL